MKVAHLVQQKLRFWSAKAMVLVSKSYGFGQQKLWFGSAKAMVWFRKDGFFVQVRPLLESLDILGDTDRTGHTDYTDLFVAQNQ